MMRYSRNKSAVISQRNSKVQLLRQNSNFDLEDEEQFLSQKINVPNHKEVQKISKSQLIQQMNLSHQSRRSLVRPKTPIFRYNSNEQSKKEKMKKIQSLGLHEFIKGVLPVKKRKQSCEVISVLKEKESQKSFKERPQSYSEKDDNPLLKVDWNPEKQKTTSRQIQPAPYIPTYLFPCRKNQTSKLKSRNFGMYNKTTSYRTLNKKVAPQHNANPLQEMKKKISQRARYIYGRNTKKNSSQEIQNFSYQEDNAYSGEKKFIFK